MAHCNVRTSRCNLVMDRCNLATGGCGLFSASWGAGSRGFSRGIECQAQPSSGSPASSGAPTLCLITLSAQEGAARRALLEWLSPFRPGKEDRDHPELTAPGLTPADRSPPASPRSFRDRPVPLGPKQAAQAAQSSKAFSITSCQGSPGTRFHLSSQGVNFRSLRMRASASTTGLSGVACERKTSYLGFSKGLPEE